MPSNWTTGYWLQGTSEPGTMDDVEIYGTEVFEVSLAEMSAGSSGACRQVGVHGPPGSTRFHGSHGG